MSSGLSVDLQKLSTLQFLSYLNEWDLALHAYFICCLFCLLPLSGEAPLHLLYTKIFFFPKWYFYLLMKCTTVAHS